MRDFVAKISLTALFVLAIFSASAAEKVTFEANSPLTVAVGEAFRVEFALNAKPDGDTFKAPSFEGFDVLAGPAISQGSSVQIVNGSMTKSVSYTYTFVLLPQAAGNVTIGAAEVKVDGSSYRTRPLPIEIVNEGEGSRAQQQQGGSNRADDTQADAQSRIGKDDILLRAVVSRSSVYKNEPLHVAFKLYTRVPYVNIVPESAPSFNGFWSQDLSDPNSARVGRETYAGKVYETRVLYDYLLYPQQAGQLHIEQFSLNAVAQIVMQTSPRGQSLFDDFFGGGQTVQEVRKNLSTAPVAITVKDFPAGAPASFNGAVGQFQMSGGIDKKTMSANASDNFTLKISGSGNLPLIQAPTVEMPTSFEQYNKKTTESLAHNANGITGYRQFEYPFIPRAEGSYTINPVEFSYFDPDAAKYVTLNTSSFNIEVRPDSTGGGGVSGIVSGINKEDLKILDKDIRFIRIGDPCLTRRGNLLFGSTAYFAALALILLVFAGGYLYLKKRLSEMQNTVLVRNRKANKVALQRLRAAFQHMNAGSEKAFYEEMLKALWGYMSDKLNIPVANLTKDNIREELLKRNVSAELTGQFIDTITHCEYAQYSPSSSGRMSELYGSAAGILSKLESVIKK